MSEPSNPSQSTPSVPMAKEDIILQSCTSNEQTICDCSKKPMPSVRYLYRAGFGPSSSHTMGPGFAAQKFRCKFPNARRVECDLYGSLSETGKGHFTDKAILSVFEAGDKIDCEVFFLDKKHPAHPNTMVFRAYDASNTKIGESTVCSTGGGALKFVGCGCKEDPEKEGVYSEKTMEQIIKVCESRRISLVQYVMERELAFDERLKILEPLCFVPFREYLDTILDTMMTAIDKGLEAKDDYLLRTERYTYRRCASKTYEKAMTIKGNIRTRCLANVYATAVSEENAGMGKIVTAPTCGSCGIVPGVLRVMKEELGSEATNEKLIDALIVASVIGNLAKCNASISGAVHGCQAEIGVATAMAAAAACFLQGGDIYAIERAAEHALEACIGLTCDPVGGYVIIPCIQRNGDKASDALSAAARSLLETAEDGLVTTLDECILAMKRTGELMSVDLKETSKDGLAKIFEERPKMRSQWNASMQERSPVRGEEDKTEDTSIKATEAIAIDGGIITTTAANSTSIRS